MGTPMNNETIDKRLKIFSERAALPKALTKAYASIVAARIGLRELASDSDPLALPPAVSETIDEMRRLAFTQEALVAVSPTRDDRAAAAFVAASAHFVVLQAERLLRPDGTPSRLDIDGISPEVSGTLLFLVAESSADASEMAKAIKIDDSANPVQRLLLLAIQHLANGTLPAILNAAEPASETVLIGAPSEQATAALYLMLLRGVRALAAKLLGQSGQDPQVLFAHVGELCSRQLTQVDLGADRAAYSTYAGPSHMAALLTAAAQDLPAGALALLPAPPGLAEDRWASLVSEIARSATFFLWGMYSWAHQ